MLKKVIKNVSLHHRNAFRIAFSKLFNARWPTIARFREAIQGPQRRAGGYRGGRAAGGRGHGERRVLKARIKAFTCEIGHKWSETWRFGAFSAVKRLGNGGSPTAKARSRWMCEFLALNSTSSSH